MELNAILSGISAWQTRPVGRSGGVPPAGSGTPGGREASGVVRPQDSFEQGQWWKNRAMTRPEGGSPGAGACSCRSCPACAVRAYAGISGSPVAAGVGGDGGAVVSGSGLESAPTGGLTEEVAAASEQTAGVQAQAVVRELGREEQLEVARLQQLDSRVKAHEMAHLAVAGPYARGGASFSYSTGPDGKKYATGGEVSIDTSREPSPDATIRKMRIIRAAAMAPADPSPQDRKVAAQADAAITEARRELELIRLEQQRAASRQELDMLSLGHREGQNDDASGAGKNGYAPPLGTVSPMAARQAAATLAGLGRAATSQLHIAA